MMLTFAWVSLQWPWIFLLIPLPFLFQSQVLTAQSKTIELPARLHLALQNATDHRPNRAWLRKSLLWLAWISLLIAIAQPSIPDSHTTQPASGRTMILAIDLSSSMERKDFLIDNVAVDRLTVVKNIATDFIRNRRGDRVGLVLFSSETYIASPPSFDLTSVAQSLINSGTGMAGRTTAIGEAIGMSIKALKDDSAPEKAIILLSDGTNNAGSVEPESAAKLALQLGIPIHTIGLGSDPEQNNGNTTITTMRYSGVAADLDEDTLRSIAELSGGEFFRARTTQELQSIYATIDNIEGAESKPPTIIAQRNLTHIFVLILLLLMLSYTLSYLVRHWSRRIV